MNSHQQYSLDSLERVQNVLDAHPELSALKGTALRSQLDTAVSTVNAQRSVQGTATLELAGMMQRQTSLVATLKKEHMEPIARYARIRLKGVPDIKALTVDVHGLSGSKLVAAARDMAMAATPYTAELAQGGFPADAVPQLQQAANALATALGNRSDATRSKSGSTAGIKQSLLSGRDAVRMLDPVVRKMLAGNAALLAEWQKAKRIVKKPVIPGSAIAPVPAPTAIASPASAPALLPAATTPVVAPVAATPAASLPAGAQEVKAA